MIKVLIVDDHAIIRKGLRQVVTESPGIVVAGEAAGGRKRSTSHGSRIST